jgi:deoxyribonuclease V
VGGVFVCFARGGTGIGDAGDRGWAAAVLLAGRRVVESSTVVVTAGAPYAPGLLAMREGELLEAVVRSLARPPDVLEVNATGRDHPRRAGLALHLGAVLDLPTVGVTHRPLLARGSWPEGERGAWSPLTIDGEVVACWLRTQARTRPIVAHAGWQTDPATATAVVLASTFRARTPEPLRQARRLARTARAGDHGSGPAVSRSASSPR